MPVPWTPYAWPDDTTDVGDFTPMPWVSHSRDMATWVTKGPNCPVCNTMSGRTYPLAYWLATIQPGWHDHCDCRLVKSKSGVLESPHDLYGTEPIWWDPTMTLGQYLTGLLDKFLGFFNGRMDLMKLDGDAYSGFDNQNPILKSNNWYTSPAWTILSQQKIDTNFPLFSLIYEWATSDNYATPNLKINLFGMTGISGNVKAALLNLNPHYAKLPSETSNKALPNPKLPDYIRARNR
jgi:hypothetical protein